MDSVYDWKIQLDRIYGIDFAVSECQSVRVPECWSIGVQENRDKEIHLLASRSKIPGRLDYLRVIRAENIAQNCVYLATCPEKKTNWPNRPVSSNGCNPIFLLTFLPVFWYVFTEFRECAAESHLVLYPWFG